MTDAEKEHLFSVADMMLFFAKQARREGILALDYRFDEKTMRICEFDESEAIDFPELSDDEHFAFALLLKSIVDGTASAVVAQIAQNLQKSTENTLSLQLGIEAVKDIQTGLSEESMTLKIFAVMGRELSLEYMEHRKDFANATEEEIAEYFCKTGSKSESCTELNLQAFEDIADFSDEDVLKILRELEISEVATALKTGSEKMYCKIRDCLPSKVARALTETMEFMGPVLISDVRAAQEHFVQIADQVLQ